MVNRLRNGQPPIVPVDTGVVDTSKGTAMGVVDASKGEATKPVDASKGTAMGVVDASKGTAMGVVDASTGTETKTADASMGTETKTADASMGEVRCAKDLEQLPSSITALTILSCDDYKMEQLSFAAFPKLETLRVCSKCFAYPSHVEISGLYDLTAIVVEDDCFAADDANAELVVKDCSRLQTLSIGNQAFSAFKHFSLSGLPLLETLTIGSHCFVAADFVIDSMDLLETVQLGEGSFEKAHHTAVASAE